ncbi:putative ATP-dependent DEAD/H RNA helicase [Trypanosoma theileri]|uniref:Putative ATP-dependent DEAD/H RNA helicase n=1 Tax=Trypanosoma theileri TaxID=67003 RepID=A0A1X0P890_9TRYP|nr:putative ATP-dependent DEAD/H RNA helicase [Trypanosoma theileri]XP_028887208.1 putative ATP-dependent DEAD/H RNA helicase [Trypanosoma theileri]ORC93141.1 putative ATP-dependent DEAD/H RNA helicase [Trypanosoma theileri]ORC93142.1 putative ATP-dependent DEAD/H RNA helicase [Trypanosoma theileri]
MSSGTGEPQTISAALTCMLEIEHEMGRTEVEIVENEERKKLYRMYKSSTAVAVKERLTHEYTSVIVNTSHYSCYNDSPHKVGNITTNTSMEQYVMEDEIPQRSCSPMKWWKDTVDDKIGFSENSNIGSMNSNYNSKISNYSSRFSRRPSVLVSPSFSACDSLQMEWPACKEISPSFCRHKDKQPNEKSGRTRWNISTNIHSKPTAFRTSTTVSSDSHLVRPKTFFRGGKLPHSSTRITPRADVGEHRSSKLSFVIHPPPGLVLERLKRLQWRENLLRIELEREALEDWYILRGEFIGMGSKLVEKVLLGFSSSVRDEQRSVCKLGIYSKPAIPISFSYDWERAKRRQEKRFISTELYGLRTDTNLVSYRARAPIDTKKKTI